MNNYKKYVFMGLVGLCLTLVQLSSCYSIKTVTPSNSVYWNEGPSGNILTNDIERLQKSLPFTILLPDYFPEELKSNHPECVLHHDLENQEIHLIIYYDSINPRELMLREDYPVEQVNENVLATALLDYNPVKLKDIQVLEQQGVDYITRSTQQVQVSSLDYVWQRDNIYFMVSVLGFDQAEARKIIESMIR
jgi:hypothetical protein